MKGEPKPILLAIASDLHAGSTLGLCPPVFSLSEGGTYKASTAQRWLWRRWLEYITTVQDKAKQYGVGYTAILNGDVIEGNHHNTFSVISGSETVQMRVAEAVLDPLLQDADAAYFVRGTPAHVGEGARLEEKIADNWTNTIRDGDNASRWHLLLDVNGTLLDVAHHGRIGRMPWTRPNGAHGLAAAVIADCADNGQRIPDLVLRAHWHQYVDTFHNYNSTRLIAMPAWQLVTGYVQRFTPGALADIGGLIVTCWPGGRYELDVIRFRPKRATPERIRT